MHIDYAMTTCSPHYYYLLALRGPLPLEGDHGERGDAHPREAIKHLLALTREAADLSDRDNRGTWHSRNVNRSLEGCVHTTHL